MSQLTKIIYGAIQWFALKRRAETHVIDDHAQSRMAFGDLAELQHGLKRKGHDRNVVALGCVPKPISRAVLQPEFRAALVKRHAYSQHAELIFPSRHQCAAFGLIDRDSSHDCETIRM